MSFELCMIEHLKCTACFDIEMQVATVLFTQCVRWMQKSIECYIRGGFLQFSNSLKDCVKVLQWRGGCITTIVIHGFEIALTGTEMVHSWKNDMIDCTTLLNVLSLLLIKLSFWRFELSIFNCLVYFNSKGQ